MVIIKKGKRETIEGKELPNQESIRYGIKRKLQIPGNIRRYIQANGQGGGSKKRYLRRTGKLHETKLCCRNLIKGMNSWTVSFVRKPMPGQSLL